MTTSDTPTGRDPVLLYMADRQTTAMQIVALLEAASALAAHPAQAHLLMHIIDGASKLAQALDDALDSVVLNKLERA